MRAIGCGSHVVGNWTKDNKNIIDVYMETMANICKQYIPKKKEIHFCKIDVEGGHEKNVLLGYDFKNYRPKVFCIESTYPGFLSIVIIYGNIFYLKMIILLLINTE